MEVNNIIVTVSLELLGRHRLWAPPILVYIGYQRLFPRGQSDWSVKLTTHVQLVVALRMCGVMPQLPICLYGVVLN